MTMYRGFKWRHPNPYVQQLAAFNATTGWTAFNTDCTNITTDNSHVYSTASLEFDKVDGAANTVYALVNRTLTTALDLSWLQPFDEIVGLVYIPDLTNVANTVIRLGDTSANYNEWTYPDTSLTANRWCIVHTPVGECTSTGTGWTPGSVDYIAVGVQFDAEANALADMYWNYLAVMTTDFTST